MKSLVMFIGQAKAAFKRALLFLCCVVLSVVSSFAAGGSPGASAITKVTTEIGTNSIIPEIPRQRIGIKFV